MRRLTNLCLGLLVTATLPISAGAQTRPIELGIDGAVTWTRSGLLPEGDRTWRTSVDMPAANFRIGFLTADRRWSVEPNFAFHRFSAGEADISQLQVDLGLLYHFAIATARDPGKPQPYLRPFLGFERTSFEAEGDADASDSRARFGVGLGVKLPMIDRLSARLEGRYIHTSEADAISAADGFALGFGLSFFTR